jgi:hypothetical protein
MNLEIQQTHIEITSHKEKICHRGITQLTIYNRVGGSYVLILKVMERERQIKLLPQTRSP